MNLRLIARTGVLCLGLAGALDDAKAAQDLVVPEVLVKGLHHPWALAFVAQDQFLVTERRGNLRLAHADGRLSPPLKGVPAVVSGGQGGLLDVVLDSDFANNRVLYLCYSEAGSEADGQGSNSTALASAKLSTDRTQLEEVRVLFSQRPKVVSRAHFGCRIAEGMREGKPDGTLFLGLGDRFSESESAQRTDSHLGKLVRINKDGSVPASNPFRLQSGALPEVYSVGHRNIQGLSVDAVGQVWALEHGPQGGDELNRPVAGRNYGWPVITYGERYGGGKLGEGTSRAGMEQPIEHWVPSIAPSGMAWLSSQRYGAAWQGSLFTGSLKFQHLLRLQVKDGKVISQTPLLKDLKQRIRDVRQGPDGLLYVLTDSNEGQLIRVQPAR